MPAHTPEDAVGVVRIGDGSLLTATDRFGNAEADRFAKLAVEEHRVPVQLREAVLRHVELQLHLAKWIGQVTTAGGDWEGGGPARDTASSQKKANREVRFGGGLGRSLPSGQRSLAGIGWLRAAPNGSALFASPAQSTGIG